jgi:hypothetical protein
MTFDILRDTLHTLLCDVPHENNMLNLLGERDPCKCYYYLEKSLSTQLELPDHVYWTDQCKQLMELLSTDQPSLVLTSVYRVLNVLEKLNSLTAAEQSLFELFYKPDPDAESDQYCEE